MAEVIEQVFEAPQIPEPDYRNDKWLRERRAFYRLLPELLKTSRGKWVAVHNEEVVEVGDSLQLVLKKFWNRFPKTEVYIQLVDEEVPVIRMLSPQKSRHSPCP